MMTTATPIRCGFQAAEQWHISLYASADEAQGYFFPSGLRRAFEALPDAAGGDFLDAIGALLVSLVVTGEPEPGAQDLRGDVQLHALPYIEQDRLASGYGFTGGGNHA